MGRVSVYAVAVVSLAWSLYCYGQFIFCQTLAPLLLASIFVLFASVCVFVVYDVETVIGGPIHLINERGRIPPIIGRVIMRRILIPAIVVVGLLWSYSAVGRFVFAQDASPMLHVLSILFVVSVCGLVGRDMQIMIGRRA